MGGDPVEEKINRIVDQRISERTKSGGAPMGDGCLDCVRKDNQLDNMKVQHQHELEKLQGQLEAARGSLSQAHEQADSRSKEAENTVREVMAHIQDPGSCHDPANCDLSRQLADYRRKTLSAQDVGDWLKEHQAIGVVDGQEVKSIEIEGKGGRQ